MLTSERLMQEAETFRESVCDNPEIPPGPFRYAGMFWPLVRRLLGEITTEELNEKYQASDKRGELYGDMTSYGSLVPQLVALASLAVIKCLMEDGDHPEEIKEAWDHIGNDGGITQDDARGIWSSAVAKSAMMAYDEAGKLDEMPSMIRIEPDIATTCALDFVVKSKMPRAFATEFLIADAAVYALILQKGIK